MKRILSLALVVCAGVYAQNAAPLQSPAVQFLDNNGAPLSGGYLRTCTSGSACSALHPWSAPSTPLATYTDSTAGTPNTNPIVLDSAGRANVWLGASAYKLVLTDASGVVIWTQDGVTSMQALKTNGVNFLSYTASGTGAVVRTVAAKLGDVVSVKDYGAKGDGVTDDASGINAAITAAYVAGGGQVLLPATGSCYAVASPILLKGNVTLVGAASGTDTLGTANGACLRPTVSFSGAAVVLADPANLSASTPVMSGAGAVSVVIDMVNIASNHAIAFKLLSLSAAPTFQNDMVLNQNNGQFLYVGKSANAGALLSDGLTFQDFYTHPVYGNVTTTTDPGVIVEESNELVFMGARSKIQGSGKTAGGVGVLVRTNGTSGVNGVTFDGISVAGFETGIKTAWASGVVTAPRHVRVLNCNFEQVNTDIALTGTGSTKTQFSVIGPGNRIVSNYGSTPTNVALDYASNNTVIWDDLEWNGGSLVSLSANASANTVWANPSNVTDAGTGNTVYGHDAAGAFVVGTAQQTVPLVAVNAASSASFPKIALQRAGTNYFSVLLTDAFTTNGVRICTASNCTNVPQSGVWQFGQGIAFSASGQARTRFEKYSASLTPVSVPAGTCTEQAFTVTGIAVGDVALNAHPQPVGQPSIQVPGWAQSGANTVTIQYCNATAGALTPTAGTYIFAVMQ